MLKQEANIMEAWTQALQVHSEDGDYKVDQEDLAIENDEYNFDRAQAQMTGDLPQEFVTHSNVQDLIADEVKMETTYSYAPVLM